MPGLLGRHDFQIDAKGRVSFPAAFRRSVSGNPMVLLQWQKTHLHLFPDETWAGIEKNLLDHRKARKDGGAYLRRITANAVEVEPDSAGRIRIPAWHRVRAGLDGEVVFVGAVDRIELWNPARFEKQLASADAADDDFVAQIFS